ncbi:hypothetical protein PSTT_04501 [Puccinia striiformis]|uniref:histidine kinase n=1 Tax=Puccinia striiformis TaxID=27350 RepID=A0A2S4VSC6_9BASI|nr:hypothetical protein PSTT_04501 [Puccinia striiformis]
MSDQDSSSQDTLKTVHGLPTSTPLSRRSRSGSSPGNQLSNAAICYSQSGTPSDSPSAPLSPSIATAPFFPTRQSEAAAQHHYHPLSPTTLNSANPFKSAHQQHSHRFPSRPTVSPIQVSTPQRSATDRQPTQPVSLYLHSPTATQSASYSALPPPDQPPQVIVHHGHHHSKPPPCPTPTEPPPQRPFHLHPALESYLLKSSQLVFIIPARPLFKALCRRRQVGLFEDPDEHAQFPIYDGGTVNISTPTSNQRIVYPHVTPEEADSGGDYNLSQLLSPIYANPAAEELAHQILERTAQPIGKQAFDPSKGWYWDIMKLLHHHDLSRWLDWLRGILSNNEILPSSFKTTLKTSHHFTAPASSSHRRKRHNHDPQPSPSTDESSSVPSVATQAPEIIMTAQVYNTDQTAHDPPSVTSEKTLTPDHHIIFSAIVLRYPSHSDRPGPLRETAGRSPNPQAADLHPTVHNTSQDAQPNPIVYYSTSDRHLSKHPSSEALRPKRIKTSATDSSFHPSASRQDFGTPLTNTIAHTMSQQGFTSCKTQSDQIFPKVTWLDENNAKRLFLKSSRRSSRPNAARGYTVASPNLSVPPSTHSRRGSVPSRSGLSHAAQQEEKTQTSSSEPKQSPTHLDKMVLDDPWFPELSDHDLDTYSLPQSTPTDPHSQIAASVRQPHCAQFDEIMASKEHSSSLSFAGQSPILSKPSGAANDHLTSIQEEYADQDRMNEICSEPLHGGLKSTISSPRSSRSHSFSSSSSLSTCHPRDSDDGLFLQSLRASATGKLILELDWSTTPIGPIENWSPTLRSMVTLILASPYRMSLLWGDDCVMLYNGKFNLGNWPPLCDAYVRTCGLKHPSLLGQSGAHGWAELWADLGDIANSVLQGDVYTVYDSLLFFDRDPNNPNGIRKEESYHSFRRVWIPVRGPSGQVEGILNPSFETTLRVIAERRLGSLRDLVQITLMSRNRIAYQERCLESFAKNPYDLPFVIMYSCESKKNSRRSQTCSDESASDTSNGSWINLQLRLAGAVGVPKGHPSAAEQIQFNIQMLGSCSQSGSSCHSSSTLGHSTDNNSSSPSSVGSQRTMHTELTEDDSVVWPLREACTFRKPIYIAHLGDRAKGFEARGWPDQTRSAVVMPVSTSEDSAPLGVIVFGLSPSHEEEAQRLEDLAALDRAKTTFFTNISHELRTPLTLIVGPISMILESSDISPAARERLKVVEVIPSSRFIIKIELQTRKSLASSKLCSGDSVYLIIHPICYLSGPSTTRFQLLTGFRIIPILPPRNTQRLINLVNQLLDLSRFEAGKMVARFKGTDVSKLTANLSALFRSAMHKNQINFVVDCPDTPRRVWVDQDFFEKVVFNILSNSMKFTPKGGKVMMQVRYDSNNCYLICSDTGKGIKQEELPKIFERFHRAEDSHIAEGTGIGLALVQDIIKLHCGLLDVESQVDRGSKFTITFRLGVAHLPPDSLDHSTESEIDQFNDRVIASNARRWILGETESTRTILHDLSPSNSDSSSSRGSTELPLASMNEGVLSTEGSTVLIADDNSDMRAFLKSVLSRYYNVVEAVDGQQAYQWAKLNRPDILVSDVMMPGMDGFELLRRLKADSDTAGMSIILLSARAGSESRIEGLAEGADDYLVKPFEAKELVARVNTHLQIAKMRQRLEGAVATRTQLLRENEEKYRELYHTFEVITMLSPVGIFQLSPNGQITFANNAFRSQCKLVSGEPLSLWMNCIHPLDRSAIGDTFEMSIRGRQPIKGEFRWRDGSWCYYELTPYYKEDDGFEGYLGSTTDVTERKESEQKQLEAAEARARDAEESKRQQEAFIDMTSHEIRNPLHGIHQAAELLYSSLKLLHGLVENNHQISGPDLVQIRNELCEDIDAIESIQLCASHQSRIADDIINVSKLSMGLLSTIKTDFDLVGRVREVLSMYLIEAQQKSVDLKLQIGEGLEITHYICADPNRLAQVIINFLSNALRYTSNSDGPRSVTVRVDVFTKCPEPRANVRRIGSLRTEVEAVAPEDMVYAKVSVQDTARGLSPEELSMLFSRFVQANPTQDQYGGSGLGLYVSHRLIENHGGFIEVMSTKGQGSVFSFVIPTKRSVRPPITSSSSFNHRSKRGFTRAVNEEEVVDMQPASALLPGGTIAAGGGISSRLSSPDIHPNPAADQHSPCLEKITPQRVKEEKLTMSVSESSDSLTGLERRDPGLHPTHVLVVEDNTINVKVIKRQLTLKGYMVSVAMDGREALNRLYADASGTSGVQSIDIVLMDIQMPGLFPRSSLIPLLFVASGLETSLPWPCPL